MPGDLLGRASGPFGPVLFATEAPAAPAALPRCGAPVGDETGRYGRPTFVASHRLGEAVEEDHVQEGA